MTPERRGGTHYMSVGETSVVGWFNTDGRPRVHVDAADLDPVAAADLANCIRSVTACLLHDEPGRHERINEAGPLAHGRNTL